MLSTLFETVGGIGGVDGQPMSFQPVGYADGAMQGSRRGKIRELPTLTRVILPVPAESCPRVSRRLWAS